MDIPRFLAYAVVVSLVCLSARSAMADNRILDRDAIPRGSYEFATQLTCAEVPSGFNAQDGVYFANGVGFVTHIALAGTTVYDGASAATSTQHGTKIFPGPYAQGNLVAVPFEETCTWNVTATGGRSWTQTGSCTAADNSYTISNVIVKGQLGALGAVEIETQVEPVETIFTHVNPAFSNKRICVGTSSGVRVPKKQ